MCKALLVSVAAVVGAGLVAFAALSSPHNPTCWSGKYETNSFMGNVCGTAVDVARWRDEDEIKSELRAQAAARDQGLPDAPWRR